MRRLFILINVLFVTNQSIAQSIFVRDVGGEVVENVMKFFGKETLASKKIIRTALGDDFTEYLVKSYDDEVVEFLAKDLSSNPKLKDVILENPGAFKIWTLFKDCSLRCSENVIEYFAKLSTKMGPDEFAKRYRFVVSDNFIEVYSVKRGKRLAKIDNYQVYAYPSNSRPFNQFLSEGTLIKNTTYNIKGQKYVVGNNPKQFVEIKGTLVSLPSNLVQRDNVLQGLSKVQKDANVLIYNGKTVCYSGTSVPRYKDQAGHIIGNQFGGVSETINYLPMTPRLNGSGGEWYKMEQEWAGYLRKGVKVNYRIEPVYSGISARPDKIYVSYSIAGKRVFKEFNNNLY